MLEVNIKFISFYIIEMPLVPVFEREEFDDFQQPGAFFMEKLVYRGGV